MIARLGIVAALVEDLADREEPRQRLAHHAVDPVRALGAARDIDQRQRRVEAEAARERPRGCLPGASRLTGLPVTTTRSGGEGAPPGELGEGHGDAGGEARGDPVGEAGDGRLLVDHDRYAERAGREGGRHADEAAGGEEHGGSQAPQKPARTGRSPRARARGDR